MAERAARSDRVGSIDGAPTRFVSHHLDPESGTITITAVQRGSRSLERLQRAMTQTQMTVTLPDDPHLYVTTPGTLGVTTTGTGEQAFHRARLVLHIKGNVHQLLDPAMEPVEVSMESTSAADAAGEDDLATPLARIEAKLDRILLLVEREH